MSKPTGEDYEKAIYELRVKVSTGQGGRFAVTRRICNDIDARATELASQRPPHPTGDAHMSLVDELARALRASPCTCWGELAHVKGSWKAREYSNKCARCTLLPDSALVQAARELRERKMSTFMSSGYANGWHEAITAVEHMAREIAEGKG